MRGKHDLNQGFFGLCQLILLLALALGERPNARYNWIFFIPIFVLCIYSVFFCASESASSDFAFSMALIGLIPTASDYILLRNSQPALRKIGQKKATSEMTFTERLVWSASLLATLRGIGWAHEPTSQIPPRPTASRGKFIASQFLWIIFYSILFDVALLQLQQNPCFRTGGPSLTTFGWWWRTTVWFHIVTTYCALSGLYATLSIISVATGLYEPGDWPHLFGSLRDAYTLRKCWGYVLTTSSFFYNPPHKIRQSRLAPDASQDPNNPRKIFCERPPSPKRNIHNLLQTVHDIFHLRTHARYWRLHALPEFLRREVHSIFPSPSSWHHVRRCGYCSRPAPGI